ncbi:MAG: DUF748 domain-containing protein [Candidatus Omnitrophica bacterium]|nr:DUF748 domain-containing protein [Candidatus Omnitrophota bacterium]MBU0895947.1 DUF748 domain-containing protein [Candidatus Omnitrophota bacterium]MBU1037740.1 DUF748 domain-containing protein [Candidatus Omnitrophota bacterium]MBU1809233.1 DUF748 domain-containing protein [Candidatus Omnitrophota bacterium]
MKPVLSRRSGFIVMSFIKALFKFFVFSSLLMAVVIGSMAVYMKLYGNAQIKKALSDLAGVQVEFKSVALNLNKAAASFRGFTIANQIGFDNNIFNADTLAIAINREKLEKEKMVVFDSVYVKGAKLYIIRNSAGALNVSLPNINTAMLKEPLFSFENLAYAAESGSKNPFYDLLKNLRNIKVEDSSIVFEDRFKMVKPYKIWCDRLSAEIVSNETAAGYLATTVAMNLILPQSQGGNGWLSMKGSMAVYPDVTNMELTAETGNIELPIFMPYFERNTPFYFRSGRFSSKTDFSMDSGNIDSLTTMYISNMNLRINPYDPKAQFLQVSIKRLAPYLLSGNDSVFDFVIKGNASKPQFGVGPKVKFAIGMVAMEEVVKAVQQIQAMQ